MAKDFVQLNQTVRTDGRMLAAAAPDTMKAFGALGRAAYASGALDTKTKELISFALSVAARCDGCLAYHGSRLAELGASREEVVEAIGVAIQMGGGPSVVYAGEALRAFDGFATEPAAAAE
ncbi:MAG: carboxymuconolactone decarboxylase family protein [Rhizobiaceae bacterium]